jgi:hypothetical protein
VQELLRERNHGEKIRLRLVMHRSWRAHRERPDAGSGTPALLDERAPAMAAMARDEALAPRPSLLHQPRPATVRHFAWWSNLSRGTCCRLRRRSAASPDDTIDGRVVGFADPEPRSPVREAPSFRSTTRCSWVRRSVADLPLVKSGPTPFFAPFVDGRRAALTAMAPRVRGDEPFCGSTRHRPRRSAGREAHEDLAAGRSSSLPLMAGTRTLNFSRMKAA